MEKDDILIVEAEILPDGIGGWVIKATNKESGQERFCKTIKEYSDFLNESVLNSKKSHFQAVWNESLKATPQMIADVREELMKFNEENFID